MNLSTTNAPALPVTRPAKIPAAVKWALTGFFAVWFSVYWADYGPTNFLYFCDAALIVTLFAVWTENALLASMAAVGILLPQFLWCIDFSCELMGFHLTHMTSYMVDPQRPLFLRALSSFHGWLPFLLVFLIARLGYDKRALLAWTALAWAFCLISYFFLPPAGAILTDPNMPHNVDYVFGLNDAEPQHWLPQGLYLVTWMIALPIVLFVPMHFILKRFFGQRAAR